MSQRLYNAAEMGRVASLEQARTQFMEWADAGYQWVPPGVVSQWAKVTAAEAMTATDVGYTAFYSAGANEMLRLARLLGNGPVLNRQAAMIAGQMMTSPDTRRGHGLFGFIAALSVVVFLATPFAISGLAWLTAASAIAGIWSWVVARKYPVFMRPMIPNAAAGASILSALVSVGVGVAELIYYYG